MEENSLQKDGFEASQACSDPHGDRFSWYRNLAQHRPSACSRKSMVTKVVLAVIMLVLLARQAPPFREVSDGAILEIYTLEALRAKLLVGPYSRFGWHHPGPLFFYWEAP